MTTATEPTLQLKTISPGLTVNDIQQSIRFFEGLGFVVEERWEDRANCLASRCARATPAST